MLYVTQPPGQQFLFQGMGQRSFVCTVCTANCPARRALCLPFCRTNERALCGHANRVSLQDDGAMNAPRVTSAGAGPDKRGVEPRCCVRCKVFSQLRLDTAFYSGQGRGRGRCQVTQRAALGLAQPSSGGRMGQQPPPRPRPRSWDDTSVPCGNERL